MRRFDISADELRRLYWAERKSAKQIGEMFGFCQVTVLKKMWKFGIPRRTDSEALSGDLNPMFGIHRHGKNHPWYGRHHTKHAKEKIRQAHLGKKMPESVKLKISMAMKGRKITWGDKISRSLSKSIKSGTRDYNGVRNPFYGKAHSEDTRRLIGEKAKDRWKDLEYRKLVVGNVMKACCIKPNRKEKFLINLIDEHGLPFKYVGDGQFILGGCCPDFLNHDGKKQLIELFGDYWHNKGDEEKRVALFKQYGFDTLVIWEHELCYPSEVITKIKSFAGY